MSDFKTLLRFTRNAHTWSDRREASLGGVGDFEHPCIFRRFGSSLYWVFESETTDDCRADLVSASIQLNGSGKWVTVAVSGGAYTDDTKPWSIQDTVNYIPVQAERPGTRSPAFLRQLPGCAVFANLATNAPVRGGHDAEGLLLTVSGQTLHKISSNSTVTNVGTIPGVRRCSIAHNNNSQVAIANGQSGYVYNTKTNTLAQITDDGFPGAKFFLFLGNYIVGVEPSGRYFFHSELNDATSYNVLDRSEAETQPDRIVSLGELNGELAVLGERTLDFYRNTGDTEGAFERIGGATANVGCAATHSVVSIDSSMIFLGSDGFVYQCRGYDPVRISTYAIEQAIARSTMSDAWAFSFEDRGHKVYYLTLPDGQTFGYDCATQEWHRRKSYGLDFWRMSSLVKWNGVWIGGDYANGKLYQLDWRLNNDAGEPLERIRRFPVLHDDGNRVAVDALRLFFNTGETQESPPLPELIVDVTPGVGFSIDGDITSGYVGDARSGSYTVQGGVQPVTVAVSFGSLPPGVTMNSAGVYSGAFTTAGSYTWTVTATDAEGNTTSVSDSASVRVALFMADSYSYSWAGGAFSSYSATIDWTDATIYPQASADGAVVAYRKPGNDIGISRWGSGSFTAQTITGTTPGTSGTSMTSLDVSSDGNWVAVAASDVGAIYVYHYTGSNTYAYVGSYAITNPYCVCFSPDDTQLFIGYGTTGRVVAFNTTTGAIGATAWNVTYPGSFANMGKRAIWVGDVIAFRIYSGAATPGVRLVNATTGALGSTYTPTGATDLTFDSFDFDGSRLVVAYQKSVGNAVRVTLVSGTTIGTEGTEAALTTAAFAVHLSPTGDAVFLGNSSATRYAYTISSTSLTATTAPATGVAPFLWTDFLP